MSQVLIGPWVLTIVYKYLGKLLGRTPWLTRDFPLLRENLALSPNQLV